MISPIVSCVGSTSSNTTTGFRLYTTISVIRIGFVFGLAEESRPFNFSLSLAFEAFAAADDRNADDFALAADEDDEEEDGGIISLIFLFRMVPSYGVSVFLCFLVLETYSIQSKERERERELLGVVAFYGDLAVSRIKSSIIMRYSMAIGRMSEGRRRRSH